MTAAEERYSQYRWSILAQACDEAPIGIWEPYWWANNVLRDLPVEDRLSWAERAMLELLSKDFICFYRERWPGRDARQPLSNNEALAAIKADAWRQIPLREADIWFEATGTGDRRMGQAVEAGEWRGEASVAPGSSSGVDHTT
jgi:hypothetical protein